MIKKVDLWEIEKEKLAQKMHEAVGSLTCDQVKAIIWILALDEKLNDNFQAVVTEARLHICEPELQNECQNCHTTVNYHLRVVSIPFWRKDGKSRFSKQIAVCESCLPGLTGRSA